MCPPGVGIRDTDHSFGCDTGQSRHIYYAKHTLFG